MSGFLTSWGSLNRKLLDTVEIRKLAYYGHTMKKQGSCLERYNARNNARCTQSGKTTHSLDVQYQDVARTPRGRINQNDRTEINGESTFMVWLTLGSRTNRQTKY